jgi:hypothetical protein
MHIKAGRGADSYKETPVSICHLKRFKEVRRYKGRSWMKRGYLVGNNFV